jgi:hypothetical protein
MKLNFPFLVALVVVLGDTACTLVIFEQASLLPLRPGDQIGPSTSSMSELVRIWNTVHAPISTLLQPVFFGSTSNNPGAPSFAALAGYFASGVVYLSVVAYLAAFGLDRLLRRHSRKTSNS